MRKSLQKRLFPLLFMFTILFGGFGGTAALRIPEATGPGQQKAARDIERTAEGPSDTAPAEASGPSAPAAGISLLTEPHIAYLTGENEDGLPSLRATDALTRREASRMFYTLLDGTPPAAARYVDIASADPDRDAMLALGALGVMQTGSRTFSPEDPMTRAGFTDALACFFPLRTDGALFPDVPEDHPQAAAIRSARAYGWITGNDEGCFRPDEPIACVEAVVMLNRALGRVPDRAYIDRQKPAFYLGVDPAAWYYYEIVEATTAHRSTVSDGTEHWSSHVRAEPEPETGLIVGGGAYHAVYYYDRGIGDVLRSVELGSFGIDPQGRFTTGSARLDRKAAELASAPENKGLDPAGLAALLAGSEWDLILINRDNPLPDGFTIPEFTELESGYRIDSRVTPALERFLAAAREAGYRPLVCSAYRSWDKQSELFERRVRSYARSGRSRAAAEEAAAFWVARPGTSEHQAGLAVDIIDSAYQVLNRSQEDRPVQKWLMEHCAEYGFILRYPTDKSGLTGVGYEPWHYRYVGEEAAQEIMARGICLEEYLSDG